MVPAVKDKPVKPILRVRNRLLSPIDWELNLSTTSKKSSKSVPDPKQDNQKLRESDVQKMSADEYEKNSDTIMEAIRAGNFVYHVSGSAR